jgi:hypothetical protein
VNRRRKLTETSVDFGRMLRVSVDGPDLELGSAKPWLEPTLLALLTMDSSNTALILYTLLDGRLA